MYRIKFTTFFVNSVILPLILSTAYIYVVYQAILLEEAILDIFKIHYDKPKIWFNRWRIFFLSCEAFFALNNGKEYFVSHYLLKKSD